MKSEILSVKEKIGYGMGDAASHIIFDNVMLYMMFFYTDIFGIPAGFVGTMFLLARALDAISDPCMGLLADRTRSRWGKFRPWVLFGALPFGIVCVLAYSTPGSQSERQNDLCRHHLHVAHPSVHCGQHPLLRVGGCNNQ